MSYLVLARKWRPRTFETLVGQDHVVRALTHALTTQRLHHAWLFTGTRGVGKTTLSRILAKSLNCEIGITATPCGACQACVEIDAGRFIDYVELDAASNRGVDEMTQLLEQAVYSPSSGRFKVYMIDEVHMLTGHAFNAMLKTLEEPPAHVKFILATTDPQKIPVTVLSRCLQFNLKQMSGESIVGHLQFVLGQENIPFELPALRMLGQAASGSMRDALSLTDQAIAYSAGDLTEVSVRGMLGTIDQKHLIRLLDALRAGQAGAVLEIADELATRGLSYRAALADLAILLSRIAIAQRVGQVADESDPLTDDIRRLSQVLPHDAVQLFYTVAVHSRSELAIAPDEYAGFVMSCLRMLSLYSDPSADTRATTGNSSVVAAEAQSPAPAQPQTASTQAAPTQAAPTQAAPTQATPRQEVPPPPRAQVISEVAQDEPPAWVTAAFEDTIEAATDPVIEQIIDATMSPAGEAQIVEPTSNLADVAIKMDQPWASLSASLQLSGMAAQLSRQSEFVSVSGNTLTLKVATKALSEGAAVDRLKSALSAYFGVNVQLRFEIGAGSGLSAHAIDVAAQNARQKAAEDIVQQDAFVQVLVKEFGAQVIPGSVQPGPTLQ